MPQLTDEEARAKWAPRVQEFVNSARTTWNVNVNSYERRTVHALAEEAGLAHESVGQGSERHLVVSKQTNASLRSALEQDIERIAEEMLDYEECSDGSEEIDEIDRDSYANATLLRALRDRDAMDGARITDDDIGWMFAMRKYVRL